MTSSELPEAERGADLLCNCRCRPATLLLPPAQHLGVVEASPPPPRARRVVPSFIAREACRLSGQLPLSAARYTGRWGTTGGGWR